jgi:hypothetical protein
VREVKICSVDLVQMNGLGFSFHALTHAVLLEGVHAAVIAAAQGAGGDVSEPPLDLFEPACKVRSWL